MAEGEGPDQGEQPQAPLLRPHLPILLERRQTSVLLQALVHSDIHTSFFGFLPFPLTFLSTSFLSLGQAFRWYFAHHLNQQTKILDPFFNVSSISSNACFAYQTTQLLNTCHFFSPWASIVSSMSAVAQIIAD